MNKIELNKNEEYVLDMAKNLLKDADAFISKSNDFDRKNRTISLGVCAPAPIWTLAPLSPILILTCLYRQKRLRRIISLWVFEMIFTT